MNTPVIISNIHSIWSRYYNKIESILKTSLIFKKFCDKGSTPFKSDFMYKASMPLLLAEDEVKHGIWGATLNDLFYIWQHEFLLEIWITLLEKQNTEHKFPHTACFLWPYKACTAPVNMTSKHCQRRPYLQSSSQFPWNMPFFTHYIASCANWSRLRTESNCSLLVWAKIFQFCHLLSIFLVLGELFCSLSILNKFKVFCSDRLKSGWQSIFRQVFKTEFELSFKNSEKDRQFTFKYAL